LGLSEAAFTRIRTSPAAGTGLGTSVRNESWPMAGLPYFANVSAVIVALAVLISVTSSCEAISFFRSRV
jgi:hypothetical protein